MKAFAMFDILFAILAVLSLLYLGNNLISIVSKSIYDESKTTDNLVKLILLSNQLVRWDLAYNENSRVFSNKIDQNAFKNLDLSKYLQQFNFSYVSISSSEIVRTSNANNKNEIEKEKFADLYCQQRFILNSVDKVDSLEICAK